MQATNLLRFTNPRWFKWQTYLDLRIQDDSSGKPIWIYKSKMIQTINLFGFLNPRWFKRRTYLDLHIQDDSSDKPTWIYISKMIQVTNLLGFTNPRWFKRQTYLDLQIQIDSTQIKRHDRYSIQRFSIKRDFYFDYFSSRRKNINSAAPTIPPINHETM